MSEKISPGEIGRKVEIPVDGQPIEVHGSTGISGQPILISGQTDSGSYFPLKVIQDGNVGQLDIHGVIGTVYVGTVAIGAIGGSVHIQGTIDTINYLGSVGHINSGSVGLLGGSIGVKSGSVGVLGGSVGIKNGSIGLRGGSIGVKSGSVGVLGGSIGLKNGSIGIRGGSIGIKNGSIGVKYLTTIFGSVSLIGENSLQTSTAKQQIESCEGSVNWSVGGEAGSLDVSTTHTEGTKSLTFDKDGVGGTTGYIEKTISAVNLSAYQTHAILHTHLYISAITNVTKLFVRLGTDSSNYFQYDLGVAFLEAGWNGFDMQLTGRTSQAGVGADLSSVTYVAIGIEMDANGNTLSGILVDNIVAKRMMETLMFGAEAPGVAARVKLQDRNSGNMADIEADSGKFALYVQTNNPLPVTGSVNIGGGTIDITGSVGIKSLPSITGTVDIRTGSIGLSGQPIAIHGSIGVKEGGGRGTVEISSLPSITGTVAIKGTVETTATLAGSIGIKNGSVGINKLPSITGTVDIRTGSIVVKSLPSITGSIDIRGGTIDITGSVGIKELPPVTGSVDIRTGSIVVKSLPSITGTVAIKGTVQTSGGGGGGSVAIKNQNMPFFGSVSVSLGTSAIWSETGSASGYRNIVGYAYFTHIGSVYVKQTSGSPFDVVSSFGGTVGETIGISVEVVAPRIEISIKNSSGAANTVRGCFYKRVI